MLSLDFHRATGEVADAELDELRQQFAQSGGVRLPALLSPRVLAFVNQRCGPDTFSHRDLGPLGIQLRCGDAAVETALTLTLNRPPFMQLLERFTDRSPIHSVVGHIARLSPGTDQQLAWHDDTNESGRVLAISVNLGLVPYGGGAFQLRAKGDSRLRWDIANTGPGDALVFVVAPEFEHRVTPVTGDVARTVFAGWAMSTHLIPDP